MKIEKFKVLLYLKKSGMDKNGKAPIMGRITVNRTMAQFSCKERLFSKTYPSFLVDKASCTRQFKSEFSLHSLASLFPIKEGIFLPLRLSCKERLFSKTYPSFLTVKEGSTSHLGLLPSGKKRKTALLGARNRYALRLADHQRSSPYCAGWDRLDTVLFMPNLKTYFI